MTQSNFKTLATSGTLEGINKLINQYFFSDITIKQNEGILTGNRSKFYDLFNSKGKISNFIVIEGRGYKFLIKQI